MTLSKNKIHKDAHDVRSPLFVAHNSNDEVVDKILASQFRRDTMRAISKDNDPNGLHQHAPGAKLDNGKPRAGLVLRDFGNALLEVSEVGTFGAEKYTPHGWLSVKNGEERYLDAAMRHLLMKGSDSESGIDHLAHAAWNILAVLELRYQKLDTDERLKRDESAIAYPNEGQRVAEEE